MYWRVFVFILIFLEILLKKCNLILKPAYRIIYLTKILKTLHLKMFILRFFLIVIVSSLFLMGCGEKPDSSDIKSKKDLISHVWHIHNVSGHRDFDFEGEASLTLNRDGSFIIVAPHTLPRVSNGASKHLHLPTTGNWDMAEDKPNEVHLYNQTSEFHFELSHQNDELHLIYEAAEPQAHNTFAAKLEMRKDKKKSMLSLFN